MADYRAKTMKISLSKSDLASKSKIREKFGDHLTQLSTGAKPYSESETFHLILSALRANEWNISEIERSKRGEKHSIDIEKIKDWIEKKVLPYTVAIGMDDEDLLKLMVFSLAMPYKMLLGETRATMSEKTRRSKQRDFEQIFSDTFIGKIGEIAFKKFAASHFQKDIKLDWGIGGPIKSFKSDIIGSSRTVSIKSTDTLEGIWAEAPITAEYGIFIKVALPKDFFMKMLAHISSLKKLLNFMKDRIDDKLEENRNIRELVNFIEKEAYNENMVIKCLVCGYFKTAEATLKKQGDELPFLGEVHGDKHLLESGNLRWSRDDWNEFFEKIF